MRVLRLLLISGALRVLRLLLVGGALRVLPLLLVGGVLRVLPLLLVGGALRVLSLRGARVVGRVIFPSLHGIIVEKMIKQPRCFFFRSIEKIAQSHRVPP